MLGRLCWITCRLVHCLAHCWHLLTSIAIIISVVVGSLGNDLKQRFSTFLAPVSGKTIFSNFSTDWGWESDFRVVQAHCIHCALYFCYCYVSSTFRSSGIRPRRLGTPGLEGSLGAFPSRLFQLTISSNLPQQPFPFPAIQKAEKIRVIT